MLKTLFAGRFAVATNAAKPSSGEIHYDDKRHINVIRGGAAAVETAFVSSTETITKAERDRDSSITASTDTITRAQVDHDYSGL
jgi:hypothetical protein